METNDRYRLRFAFMIVAWLFVLGVLVQVLLVGLSLLASRPLWSLHVDVGHSLGALVLVLLILAFVGKMPSAIVVQTGLLFGIYVIQAEVFAVIRAPLPQAAALHPVLALLLFWLSVTIAQQAWSLLRVQRKTVVSQQPVAKPIGD